MKIKTITCHDVYNVGASLQAYALASFLQEQGHDVEIIDYKPDYLSKRYNFFAVDNPRYEKPFVLKWIYLLLKFPGRLVAYPGKKNFDKFRQEHMRLTKRYSSLDELKKDPPAADLYIAGSDQIWNTLFQNGKDGSFYLDFVPERCKKASYAASFATEYVLPEWEEQVKKWLKALDSISVRESSSLNLLDKMGMKGQAVLDPVFLLTEEQWESKIKSKEEPKDIFVYDFDSNQLLKKISILAKKNLNAEVISFFNVDYSDRNMKNPGPLEFLEIIYNAKMIISNSFHATVFSLIFHKDFFVIKRNEDINVRMEDLLKLVGLEDRILSSEEEFETAKPIDWDRVDRILHEEREKSIKYIMELTNENE